MYIGEWLMWFSDSGSAFIRNKFQIPQLDKDLRPSELRKNYTKKQVSDNPRPIGPYYAYNDRYLEIRGGMFENFRGIITWISLIFLLIPIFNGYFAIEILLKTYHNQNSERLIAILAATIDFSICVLFCYLFMRYFARICRLEIFTLRHIRVRFNRITQQVYIQRPKFCGGTVVFNWKDIMPVNCNLQDTDAIKPNLVNFFYFHPYKTGLPFIDGFGIGRNINSAQDHCDEWEFIRRYMQDGPEDLPKPRLTTTLPLPFRELKSQIKPWINLCTKMPYFVTYIIMIPVFIILLPLYVIGYFFSECLCWQTSWPKIIQDAGQKGYPKPQQSKLTDYPQSIRQAKLMDEVVESVPDDKIVKNNVIKKQNN